MANETGEPEGAATEHEGAPLSELVSEEVGSADTWTLKVYMAFINEYTYKWNGKDVTTKKLVVTLLSANAGEYCLGILRARKNEPLEPYLRKFTQGSVWRVSKVRLQKAEKPCYINTSVRVAIDLRNTHTTMMLQSPSFPRAPEPNTSIKDILGLKQQQRFDLMAVPTVVLKQRVTGASQVVADIQLADGSCIDKEGQQVYATMPLTMFFQDSTEFTSFKLHVGTTPLLFSCLNGNVERGKVSVSTLKGMSFWRTADGDRCAEMKTQAPTLLQSKPADVIALPTFVPQEAKDYLSDFATLTVCSLVDMRGVKRELVQGDEGEHVYQLNHVYVPAPAPTQSVTHDGRLFAVFDCWDYTQKIQLAFRGKAMCGLAGVTAEEYENAVATGDLRHPLLASLRVRVKKNSQGDGERRDVTVLVVEAEPADVPVHDIPNGCMDALHGLLAAGGPVGSERLVAAWLADVTPSPFYNMLVRSEPVDKALVLLRFAQGSKGGQQQGSFRIVADGVTDAATEHPDTVKVSTVARCSVERCPDFTASKGKVALAIVCKVSKASKDQHAADVHIEAMTAIHDADIEKVAALVNKLREVAAPGLASASPSQQAAYEQRKSRKLNRYPTEA